MSEAALLDGSAWRAFCQRLAAIGERLQNDGFSSDPRERAKGYRAITRWLAYAMQQEIDCDGIVIYTDNETWYGEIHPSQALQRYREQRGLNTRLGVVGMTATNFSIADPQDPGMLDAVGLRSNVV